MAKRIGNINEIQMGMNVEVINKYTSTRQNGIVTMIDVSQKGRMVDSKPIHSRRVTEVIVSSCGGGEISIKPENFGHYTITVR